MFAKKDILLKICVMVLVSLLVVPIALTETVASSRIKTQESLEKVTVTVFDEDGKMKKIIKWLPKEEIKDIKEEFDKITSGPGSFEEKLSELEVFLKNREIIPESFSFQSIIERLKEYRNLISKSRIGTPGKAELQMGSPLSLLCFVIAMGSYGQVFSFPCIPLIIERIITPSIFVIGIKLRTYEIPPAVIVTHSLLGTDLYVINPNFFLILGFVGIGISSVLSGNLLAGAALAAFAV